VKFFRRIRHGDPDELETGSDLEFLAHLMGDIHQPLHTATDQDRGGNCLFVQFPKSDGAQSERVKFHGMWDKSMIEDRLGMNDRLIARQLLLDHKLTVVKDLADARSEVSMDDEGTVRTWVTNAHAAAVTQLYGSLRPAVPSFETQPVAPDCHDAAPVFNGKTWLLTLSSTTDSLGLAQTQLYLAGVRLAALLNVAAP